MDRASSFKVLEGNGMNRSEVFRMVDLTLCQVCSAYPVEEVVCHCFRGTVGGRSVQE